MRNFKNAIFALVAILSATSANGSGVSNGGGIATSLSVAAVVDKASNQFRDDFLTAATTAANGPQAPWYQVSPSGAGALVFVNKPGEADHIGIATFGISSASSADDAYLIIRESANYTDTLPRMDNFAGWWFRWIFRPITITNIRMRWGSTNQGAFSAAAPQDGFGILLDTAVNGNYQFETRIGGVQSITDSGVAANASNWIVFDVYCDVAGTIKYQINGGTVTSKAYSSTAATTLGLYLRTLTTALVQVDTDFMAFYIPSSR